MEASGQLHAPTTLTSGKGSKSHYTGGWVGPRASLDILDKRKSLALPGIKTRFLLSKKHSTSDYDMGYEGSVLTSIKKKNQVPPPPQKDLLTALLSKCLHFYFI